MKPVRDWFARHFSDPQVVILSAVIVIILASVSLFGAALGPLITAIVVAYLLDGLAGGLRRRGIPRLAAVLIVFLAFIALLLFVMVLLLPLLLRQMTQVLQQLPFMISAAQHLLAELPEQYPTFISPDQVIQFTTRLRGELIDLGQRLLTYTFSSLVTMFTMLVYGVVVPFLVFFMIKDKERILGWFVRHLPKERELTNQVWHEVNAQLGNYVRGKFLEILIVGVATYVVFALFGVQYAVLLGALTGISALVPYLGAIVVALPVALAAYFQWGLDAQTSYVILAYIAIQTIDGNVLWPMLMSDAVNLHPIAIIAAILFFGGLWGFWGVFFAVPLATVVNAVIRAWPKVPRQGNGTDAMPVIEKS